MSYDCYCDYDPAEVYCATQPRARKPHKCEECGGQIKPGETYERAFGVWEGYASTFKTCERCFNLRQWVKNNVPCFCWAHGSMLDNADEAVAEARHRARDETVGLRFGFLRRREMIWRHNRENRNT